MEFLIADTFTDSLARLTGDEQKAVKTTAFDLQLNRANTGMNFHKLDRAKDKNFWSVRVNSDIRIIVHKNEGSLLLCYVDHHDKAYDWAERRKLEIHPKTGAAQLVEIRETVQEIFVPVYVQQELPLKAHTSLLFEHIGDDDLLAYGVPLEWLKDVREATDESIFSIAEHLPAEASEALLELATGGTPAFVQPIAKGQDPFAHPDAQRRFRVMNNIEELERAIEFPWDKWAVFLHPAQRQWVERDYSGPSRVSGSAGTGKTIVALHRAVFLAKTNPDARVLLTTFSSILANSLRTKLRRLISNEPRLAERIDVYSINELGLRLYKANFSNPDIVTNERLVDVIKQQTSGLKDNKFTQAFLLSEWTQVVDAWQLKTWDDYRDVKRLGRKTRLPEQQRGFLWSIFEKVNAQLHAENLLTYSTLFTKLAGRLAELKELPFDFAVVDEAQDLSPSHLRFLASLNRDNPNALFFAGDLGQRIFQQAFSWKAVGVDIRGRARTLNVNYRTSHQIRQQADNLLAPEVTDADGNVEGRNNTVSVFNGPAPSIHSFKTNKEESEFVANWLTAQIKAGISPQEIGVFVRSENEINRAIDAANTSLVVSIR